MISRMPLVACLAAWVAAREAWAVVWVADPVEDRDEDRVVVAALAGEIFE